MTRDYAAGDEMLVAMNVRIPRPLRVRLRLQAIEQGTTLEALVRSVLVRAFPEKQGKRTRGPQTAAAAS